MVDTSYLPALGCANRSGEAGWGGAIRVPSSLDRKDAEELARLYRAGELVAIRVPTEREERVRDPVRCREVTHILIYSTTVTSGRLVRGRMSRKRGCIGRCWRRVVAGGAGDGSKPLRVMGPDRAWNSVSNGDQLAALLVTDCGLWRRGVGLVGGNHEVQPPVAIQIASLDRGGRASDHGVEANRTRVVRRRGRRTDVSTYDWTSHAPTYATRPSIFRRRSSLDSSDETMSPPTSDSLARSRRGMAA